HTRFSRDWSSDVCSSDLNANHRIRAVNEAFCRITGYAERDVIGEYNRLLWDRPEADSQEHERQAALERSGQWQAEVWHRRANGRSEERRVGKEGGHRAKW